MPIQQDFLLRHSRSADAAVASVADNCRFDERASAARWEKLDSALSAAVPVGRELEWTDWEAASRRYTEQCCHVPSVSVPDAFLSINRDSWLTDVSSQQAVVRLETLGRPLGAMGWTLNDLADLLSRVDGQAHDAEAHAAMQVFFETWNRRRDGRPVFAAFYDEVREEADDEDWPHALRDRLGLGRLGLSGTDPLPVALMRYPLAAVPSDRVNGGNQAACALPTVFDGGMHEFFFSTPKECTYGATLHLDPEQADVLTAEIVHRRFDYARDHLWRLGYITNVESLHGNSLRESRDFHLLELRTQTERHDFGELFAERT